MNTTTTNTIRYEFTIYTSDDNVWRTRVDFFSLYNMAEVLEHCAIVHKYYVTDIVVGENIRPTANIKNRLQRINNKIKWRFIKTVGT